MKNKRLIGLRTKMGDKIKKGILKDRSKSRMM